ncbi:MAG TPA: hypothetical protein GXX46_07305 [Peptococcaceae bacterium]|nr:hypothetical protein [Peptococcaceae bacterium]
MNLNSWGYLLLLGLILFFWVLAKHWEWRLPSGLAAKINNFIRRLEEEKARTAFIVNFEAREFQVDDLEKEVYIIRKSSKEAGAGLIMNVGVRLTKPNICKSELEKAKARLERRFPGLTINFSLSSPDLTSNPKNQPREAIGKSRSEDLN